VKLHRLQLQNFRQHADSVLTFETGLTGIIGTNGSGKTTILEAIAWALYGNSATRGTRDSIRFSRAAPRSPVRVELEFELAGHRYRIVRRLTDAELYLDGAGQPIANSITGVNELLQRRLGMSRSEFFNTYFTGQKELNVMAAMGPAERGHFLSRVLGYEKLRTAQTLVRDRRRMIAAEAAGLRAGMPDAEAVARLLADSEHRLAVARQTASAADRARRDREVTLAELTPRWARAQQERDRLQEMLGELRVAEAEEAAVAREADRVSRELAAVAAARAELEALATELQPLSEVAEEFQRYERLAREEGRRQTLVETERSLVDELTRLRERRARVFNAPVMEEEATIAVEAKRKELEESLGRLEARRTEWVRDRQEAETKRDALRRQYAELKTQRDRIVDLGEDGACPVCTRPLDQHFRGVLEHFDDQLETIAVDGKFYNTRLDQLEEMPDEVKALDEARRALTAEVGTLERRLAKVQAAVQELTQLTKDIGAKEQRHEAVRRDLAAIPPGYDGARHAALRREVERLMPLNDRATRLSAQIDREPQLDQDRRRVTESLGALRDRLASLRERTRTIPFSESDFASLRTAYETAAAEARAADVAAAKAQGDANTARLALDSAERSRRELERVQTTLDGLQVDRRLHDELDRAYSDLRSDLNTQLRPELSELAGAFLHDLTDARYSELELDDNYNVLVLEDGIPKPVISGGEEDLANLVLRLAISQMIAERAGQQFSLLVLDEVFGSLDESRRNNVVELLRRLQDRFEQVILITHIESVREGLDQIINVRYDEETGASVVTQTDQAVLELPSSDSSEQDDDAYEEFEATG
jgi:DNA repair protein SbcC/Rad50